MEKVDHLRREIAQREAELADLRRQLTAAESAAGALDASPFWPWPLQQHDYERYGRQLIVPGFGVDAQLRLSKARVLVVGAGGLGCPAAAYLVGAGVGLLGLVDADVVEVSNLHRQVAHSTGRVGLNKVRSAITYLRELNPTVSYRGHETRLSPHNAQDIVAQYDLVLDCTDRPASRYLVSDACVLLGKPLVSAAAFQTSGQLVVLNSPPGVGPCYRCVFPRPPPPESVVGCGEGGILGPVVGVMGVLQALEAIRLLAGGLVGDEPRESREHRMLLFSAAGWDTSFRSVRMRAKRDDCFACSARGGLTPDRLDRSVDYDTFCGVARPVALLQPRERITAKEYDSIRAARPQHILVDVREKEHFSLGSIPGAVNVPISRFTRRDEMPVEVSELRAKRNMPIYMVCRVGNDSQVAARKLKDLGWDYGGERFIGDIAGGLKAWRDAVDPTLPLI